jgi:PKD repeat protein
MTRILSILLLLVFLSVSVFSQTKVFTGQALKTDNFPTIDATFHTAEVYQIDVKTLNEHVKKAGASAKFKLELGNAQWDVFLRPNDFRGPKYAVRVLGENGIERLPKRKNITFSGDLAYPGDCKVALTIDEDFLYGFFKTPDELYFIEPLWYFEPGQPKDRFVLYKASEVRQDKQHSCGVDELRQHTPEHDKELHLAAEKTGLCFDLELAIASDRSMTIKYGNAAAVEAHNMGVMNNVQTNYDNEFADEINFVITEQFVVVPPALDPWTTSTDAGALLNSFTSWGPGGFDFDHDLGQLWTNRDFNGSTIGIAWLSGACNSLGYHCLQDFSTNAALLRVLTAHEIGHNLSASHDGGGGFIMSPSVSSTTTWSGTSIATINNFITQIDPPGGCLSFCSTSPPPLADFNATPNLGCAPLVVQYTDVSFGNPFSWQWSFPGGSPSTSTQQNPLVTYNTPGVYAATLTVDNGVGTSTVTQSLVTVATAPTPSFNYIANGTIVSFINLSTDATSYLWDFGDGVTSTLQDPTHVYATEDFFDVTLTAISNCGSVQTTQSVAVFNVPDADFAATPTTGCATLGVQFTNQSSNNVLQYAWSFPGGNPATSSIANPFINYATPGTYSATLVVTNPAGTDTEVKTNFITVNTTPTAGFTQTISGRTVNFTNISTNATSYSWNFGDGNTSTATNPTHTYANDGTYAVTLTATNACGNKTSTQNIVIQTAPTANFTGTPTTGCGTMEVTFLSTSSANTTGYAWTFAGGNPSSSTVANPVVTYSTPGIYDVVLIASNAFGTDTLLRDDYITVNPIATAAFSHTTNLATATFTNTSTNANSYLWNFGDGNTSTATNPTHTYSADGTYTVTLSATNGCGTVTTTQTVVIVTPPTAAFTANTTTGCSPMTVQFTSQSSLNAVNYNWSFPGGNPSTSTAQNPSVTYSTAGIYAVSLTVSNAAGSNTGNQPNFITVNTTPTPAFTTTTNVMQANFTNTTVNGLSYSWNFGDGSPASSQTNPTHTYPADGTYTVTLNATNGCGMTTVTQNVVISSLPQANFSANTTSGCAPLAVQFQNLSSANATSWSWEFPGGTPSGSTAQNPSVTYQTAGVYTVTLTVSNALGSNTATQTNYITVNTTPTAAFTASANLTTATFTNTSSNATSYSWNFGDGSATNTEANPVHQYAADGVYTVVLTATNTCGSVAYTQQVSIVTPPTAGFTATGASGCAPLTVQFTNQSSANATSYNWSFPGGTPAISTEANPVVVYNTPGTFDVQLTVTNPAGNNTVTQTNFITVNGTPSASFSSLVNGVTATFINATTNATGYSWNFGDGSAASAEANPTHDYAADGVYTVVLTATNGCGSVTYMQTVTIVTPPTAGFGAVQQTGCAPFTVQFSNESSDNATGFEWSFPGGTPSSSSDENPVVVYSVPGVYDVSLIVNNAAGSDTTSSSSFISVGSAPQAGFTYIVNGASATFSNTSINTASYLWNFGDGNTSTAASPVHDYAADGAFTVTLTATNECGSVTITDIVVIATQGPIAAFTAQPTSGCAPLTVVFENLSSDNATDFSWTFQGGNPATSTAENPVVTYNAPGIYNVSLTASNALGSNTYSQTGYITVNSVPTVDFDFSVNLGIVTFTNGSVNAGSYAWNFGDGNTSMEANPVHTYASGGEYEVTLTATNDCGFTTLTRIVVIVIDGVEEIPGITEFRLFPNPNSGAFSLRLAGQPHPAALQIRFVNVLGQSLHKEVADFRSGNLSRDFRFDNLPAGVYFLQIQSGEKAVNKKVAVE